MATVKRPTLEQMNDIVASLHMSMSEREIARVHGGHGGDVPGLRPPEAAAGQSAAGALPAHAGLSSGRRRESAQCLGGEEPRCAAQPYGPLSGKRIVLKDNVCLAGVPMMNGASTLEGYVPDVDATVVTRILDAGGTIVGKAHCEYFCLSGGSHTSAMGPVHNPYKYGYSAGGSSSGSGALVGSGEVEMAIGGDQGGSIRMPCVLVRLLRHEADARPGAVHRRDADRGDHRSHRTDDATVADNALLLEVIAGAGWTRPAPVRCARGQVHDGARPRCGGHAHRRGQRGLRPSRERGGRRSEGA